MKTWFVISAIIVGAVGWYLAGSTRSIMVANTAAVLAAVPPDVTQTDPVKVFQQAFWKRPTEDDQILHAERREWLDRHGVSRWQWFIAVKPGPALIKHLREDNAFGLQKVRQPVAAVGAPAWFVSAMPDEVLGSPTSCLTLAFDPSGVVYATDQGGGFRAGADAPGTTHAPYSSVSGGRLPVTMPPNSQ
jgi:hypothetical protein